MKNVRIVTDSLANLTEEEIKTYHIDVAYLNILVDNQSYVENDPAMAKDRFYQVLSQAKTLPKTSQPSIGTFLDIFDSYEEGTEIISIHVASTLSGTVDAARQAGNMSKNSVTVIECGMADRAQAYQVIEAAKLAQSGANKEEILAHIQHVRENTQLYICVFSLDNLVKGGRVSRAKGLLSSLLNIKVIFEVKNGELLPLQKGRGAKAIQSFMDETVYPDLEISQIEQCSLSYVKETEFIHAQIQRLSQMLPKEKLHIGYTIPTVAIHTGEGAFAIIYYKK
ncbi:MULTISPECIES: DegV family protein [unclassified Granulicatella]|uniref:DegV family protein n=1 Tax=unclassified Granulicatella TaxID=2630493 RepID=UPI001073B979|nr:MULTISPECIES: DegV family protein [unclassified Granulicatella]MBF0780572.1 DegV family protein [Granulicatella sp. 19428wC4_WM01]TFU94923.1 DegV family protein [Granulicatella sp. WM01]